MQGNILSGMLWKLLERFGVSGVQFVLQIILARLLSPEHYGTLSIMVIFTNLANIFIQNGFNTALIQNKEVDEDDYSSVFWVSMVISVILYGVLFICSPFIADFYNMPDIVVPMRVLALMLIPGALNSIQLAKVSRDMDFKKVFYSNIGGAVFSGVVGIIMAYMGAGIWALVAQTLLNTITVCIIMKFTVKLKIRTVCNFSRIKVLFSFGWKLLVSGLIDTLYTDLKSLVIGKKYDSEILGYHNRGMQFPQFLNAAVNGTVQSVMLPAMSAEQDSKESVKHLMRISLSVCAYILFPVMAGLAAVASPLVSILLTDKWLPCVPFMQLYCFSFAFYPVHSCNLQAINAMGRSDVFLKLEIIKKSYGIAILVFAVVCFDSPIAIAATGLVTTLISWFVNASPNKKLLGYSYLEQVKDLFPTIMISAIMFVIVLLMQNLPFGNYVLLFLQVIVGVLIYVILSVIFKLKPYQMVLNIIKNIVHKK